ncbi:MAG: asparagine--tRNA ligase [Gemmatimonadaceae bacterium 4484_173]|nr:MAG: asparagine--tRNA ligase [Gemmatimonadaceae bacterium 4484_173]RKZ03953.1 MAG: asparagine--tRNA ligase [Candidatus Fermentibacteria bacterium]
MIHRDTIDSILGGGTYTSDTATVYGWIKTARTGKSVAFASLNDGSTSANLQVVFDKISFPVEKLSALQTGACIKVTGTVVESQGKEQTVEISAKDLEIVGPVDSEYPLQKKRHSLEFLRTMPHLRSRTNTLGSVFRVSHHISMAIHRFFDTNGFFNVHTPFITESDCEGAGETFQLTTLPLDLLPVKDGRVEYEKDYFKKKAFLTVSGQLEAEPFALSMGKVYTFGPTFRADPSDTRIHGAEFWMLEPEMAFFDLEDNLKLIEKFVKFTASYLMEKCSDDIAFFTRFYEKSLPDRYKSLLDNDFGKITYTQAIEIIRSVPDRFDTVPRWGDDLATEHERYLAEEHFGKPVFVIDYPVSMKPFYMYVNDDGKTVGACDLLAPGVGELVGGSQREHRLPILEKRAVEQGLDMDTYRWYMELRRWGTAPHAGFGLGFERLLMYLTGMDNIRDVVPFPRTFGKMY